MKLKICLVIILTVAIYGCGERTADKNLGEVIRINPHDATEYVNLSEIADSIICIKLQPAPDDVMGVVGRIFVMKKYIYAVDGSQGIIFVFDKTGKFVAKLDKEGQGPGEYVLIENVFIDDDEKYIEITDWATNKKLKYVNISFELVESTPFEALYALCKRHNGFYYAAPQQNDIVVNGIKSNPGLLVVDDKNNRKILFDKKIKTNNHYFYPVPEHFALNDKNELFFSDMYNNTFYRLESGKAYPVYTVDFGRYGINNEVVGALSTEEQMKYLREMKGLACLPSLNLNNSGIMSFSYYFKQKESENGVSFSPEKDIRQYIKIKDKVYHTHRIKNDLTNFPNRLYICPYVYYGVCTHDVWFEDYFVDVIETTYYFENSDVDKIYVEGLGEITSDDEDIYVVLMKLKK
jgi:hypothetical protein